MINKHLVFCVKSTTGMPYGFGLTKESAWREATNDYGVTKDGMIEEGFTIETGVVLDWAKFSELVQ